MRDEGEAIYLCARCNGGWSVCLCAKQARDAPGREGMQQEVGMAALGGDSRGHFDALYAMV